MADEFTYREPDPNKKTPKARWDAEYSDAGYLYGKLACDSLKLFLPELTKGEALDVAMGEGRNAVFLAENGFQVTGLDCSGKGVEKALALAAEKKVSIDGKIQNLDFYLVPLMKFSTIVMTYFRPQARFFSEIKRGLILGGTFLLEAYTVEHYKHAKDPRLEFDDVYKPNEVLSLLKGFHILYYKEMDDGHGHKVTALAKKVGV